MFKRSTKLNPSQRSQSQRMRRERRGAALVEAALVLPLILMFLLGIMEYGRYVMMQQVLTNAAREGAHYALAHTEPFTMQGTTYGNATSDVQNAVTSYLGGQGLAGQTIQVYKSDAAGTNQGAWTSAAAGEMICVRITGTYRFFFPALLRLPASRAITVQSIMRSEGN